MTQSPRIWYLLADGEHARIVSREDIHHPLKTQRSFESFTAHQRSSQLGTDQPGRSYESVGGARHAIAPRHDPHRMEEEHFLQFGAQEITDAATRGDYDHVVLVAPPRALGVLRAALGTKAKVMTELGKDLLKVPDHELAAHLDRI